MAKQCTCILRDLVKGGGGSCPTYCAHEISMHGASGKGGRVASVGIPVEYQRFTVADNPIRETQAAGYRIIDRVAESYKRMFDEIGNPKDRIKNVYLYSSAKGTGKTATASALANEWLKIHYVGSLQRGEVPNDDEVYFLDMVEFQTLYTAFNRQNAVGELAVKSYERYMKMMQRAKDSGLLIMDDIGGRSASEAFRTDLHSIINYRYTKAKPTIYTANVDVTELTDVFDEKLYDRVRDLMVVVPFEGDSKRGRRE